MKDIKPAILLFVLFSVICGGIYPALVTGLAHALFPGQANGSLINDKDGRIIGSSLIGQPFTEPRYLWPRPSATAVFSYNPAASGGSNSGPTNPDYLKIVAERVKVLRESGITGPIPAELVQASASGLDPHLSPAAAKLQVPRIAKARGIPETAVQKLINEHTEGPQLGILGGARVNLLAVNLKLDTLGQ
ncbi:potassium-transporting ATPase subunit KdpC [Trichlorobacter lovleyi]|uniref:potassium-transporting ATPase subunit KdpC n=1 Tax=Trichlorobacter lovleyi TaxID=313985 RepID=UPI00223EFED2|nr:potassium-transporting ATPase subunit KdpC [Trichlorobacter lovleyi]QOX80199.1 potassium-transporting ATPase subunit KdpC [Trichlorobacter lovleyi]